LKQGRSRLAGTPAATKLASCSRSSAMLQQHYTQLLGKQPYVLCRQHQVQHLLQSCSWCVVGGSSGTRRHALSRLQCVAC
jgi:hypothetical protein